MQTLVTAVREIPRKGGRCLGLGANDRHENTKSQCLSSRKVDPPVIPEYEHSRTVDLRSRNIIWGLQTQRDLALVTDVYNIDLQYE